MAKVKAPLTNKLNKKNQKEVHKGQMAVFSAERLKLMDDLTQKEMNKKFPKKAVKKTVKKAPKKLARPNAHVKAQGKQTFPGEVEEIKSAPAYPHKEGARWNKTVVKQSVAKRKQLTKKLSKRK